MKTITTVLLTAAVAMSFIGCGAPANNAPAPTNTNTARTAPAAPTVDALMALDKQAQEAYTKGDSKFFETFLSDKFMMGGMKGKPVDKAATIKEIANVKCENAKGDFTEPQMTKIDNDTYAITYKASWEGTCTENGKSMKIPGPMRASSLYVRNGDKWQGAWHGETMIIEPKGAAKKDDSAAKPDDSKKADAAPADSAPSAMKKEDAGKPAESKKEEKAEAKKEEPKKEDAKKDGTVAANSAPAAEAKPDANTDALTKLHQAGWDAWRAKDAKVLNDMTAAGLAVVDPMGGWHGEKEEIIKMWTTEDCKDVKTGKFNDGFAFALSPTVEVLMGRGTADGTCNGQKNGTLNQTAVYVKEGADWKLAFMFESPAA